MFLLVTFVATALGFAYALFIDRAFVMTDWRRWTALAPFWVLAVAWALASQKINMTDLLPQAVQAFAVGSIAGTVAVVVRWRRLRRDTSGVSSRH